MASGCDSSAHESNWKVRLPELVHMIPVVTIVERSVIIKILLRVKTLDYHMYMYGNKLCIKGKKQSYGINALNA